MGRIHHPYDLHRRDIYYVSPYQQGIEPDASMGIALCQSWSPQSLN